MKQETAMTSSHRLGNLHISLEGEFSDATAKQLTRHISETWNGTGNIFIHTQKVTGIQPASPEIFQAMVGLYDLTREKIYFIGELGKQLCCDGGRVIIPGKKRRSCSAKCKNCSTAATPTETIH